MVFLELVLQAFSVSAERAFYGDTLGLAVVTATPDEVVFQVGEARVAFRSAPNGTSPTYHVAFEVPPNQFTAAKAWLAERVPLLREDGEDEFDWDFWAARAVYALDPAKNIIELIAFRGNDVALDAPFTAASLLGVAEVGLPVPDVPAAVAALEREFGIGLWDRTEIVPGRISPVGERRSTFIVVPLGRSWHPPGTGTAAAYPLEVILGGVGDGVLEFTDVPYRIGGAG
jgi:catechol 2,3-dioxygenase-like lactoylglutathione lyase family enzyme